MSQLIFPKLQGYNWEFVKKPQWSAIVQEGSSGKETTINLWTYPKYQITISYDFLTNSKYSGTAVAGDIENLIGFYNLVGGQYDNFLYEDPIDNTISVPQTIGTGNGVLLNFQLVRNIGTYTEPIYGVKGTPTILVNNVPTTNFTMNNYGLITFNSAPTGVITWTGSYYFRCRFLNSNLEFDQMYQTLYKGSVDLITVKL